MSRTHAECWFRTLYELIEAAGICPVRALNAGWGLYTKFKFDYNYTKIIRSELYLYNVAASICPARAQNAGSGLYTTSFENELRLQVRTNAFRKLIEAAGMK